MAERRAGAKGRRLGSSRRKQLREASGGGDDATAVAAASSSVPGPEEESPWAADVAQKVQDFFRACDREQKGFVTRADLQVGSRDAPGDFPCSGEELELVFDGLDTDGNGRLTAEELAAGLRQFLSSQRATRDHRRRKTASRRDRLAPGGPSLEEADSEERKRFAAFVDQLGTDNSFADQEIWQLWVKLRQDEPQLLGNLEDFLAKMRRRIQEAKSEKEALEVILNKRVAEHNREVQQLCEALEQQMRQEMQQLEQESEARSHQHSTELWRALDARESEVQRLVSAQTELETWCRSLRSTREATSTENRRLEQSNRELEERLQRIHLQLRETQGRLRDARAAAAPGAGDGPTAELPSEMPPSPQMSPEKSEKYRSEMRISFGSQSGERPPKSGHHVVWEKVPAEITISGPLPRVISIEEDPFPEFLKEERFSDQSSLLREMNDAIAALSKEQKSQGPGDPVPAGDVPLRLREDATTHSAAPGAPQETLASLHGREPLQGDLLQEGPAQAALGARDVTPAGASESAGHRTAQERGGEQGENPGRAGQGPEDPRRIFFVQGQGTATAEQMLEEAEGLQGAQGESAEAGAQAEVEEAGLTQEKTGREAAQPPGDAEKAALTQGENSEADPGPVEPQELELALGGRFTAEVAAPAGDAAQGERMQPASEGAELGDGADSCVWRSEKLELELGEHLDPEVQSLGEAGRAGVVPGESAGAGLQPPAAGRAVEAGQAGSGDADGLDVSQTPQLAPAEGAAWPSEARTPGATQGHVLDAGRPLAQAQVQEVKQGESSDAAMQPSAEAAEGEVARSAEAELQPSDLQRLGVSGQEQVSTQADKVRPDVAPEQLLPKEKPLWVMETEQIAAERAEPPKEEVPPGSTLYASVRRKEHAGSDLAGTLLGDSLLRDVANSGVQPPGRLSEEPRNGLDVGQWDGKQDIGLKTSQEAKPSPEDPGAASADGAGTAPRGSAETWTDPDHLYNVLFVGDSHVGKTSFLYRLHANSFNPHLTATVGLDYQIKNLVVDDKLFALRLWDSAGQERYHSITKQFFRKADGVVLMYDITSEYSFADVRYWLSCIQEGAEDGVAILLLGNKTDCAAERRVPTKEGERLAQEHQLTFYECSAASGHNVSESMVSLIRLLKIREDRLKTKVEEEPKPARKKRGCC
ncbi:ras-related protein Rab-44 [Apteryx mantelli]|uniref:Ras-related protein Rab-44 n=1 Tax=Apteryx mantelli TaxID=2696672 RepID=A0ABM4FNK3_9AVES